MRPRHFWIAILLTVGSAALPSLAAVQPLATMVNPTLQTLIDMGSTPVSVGREQFSNFSLINALPGAGVTAGQVQVQPFTNGGSGLQFVSSWFAANGTYVDEVVTFDVQVMDSIHPIIQINLLSNGTAPVPTPGTFTTTTLVSQLPSGATAAPVISTYNDGITYPSDTTKPDINYAQANLDGQNELHIIDTIFESSTAASIGTAGGVATESVVQNAFVNVPEPGRVGLFILTAAAVVGVFVRKRTILGAA